MKHNYNTPTWISIIILSLLTSPLAIAWLLLTRRELYLQFGTFTYRVAPQDHSQSVGTVHWGGFIFQPKPNSRPRQIHFSASGGNVRLYQRTYIRLLPRCPDRFPPASAGGISHSIGPVDIRVTRCDPKQPSFRGRRRLPEIVKPGRMPVFGPVGSPLGLQCVGIEGSEYDSTSSLRSLALVFANGPTEHEDPTRTQEYLDQVRRDLNKEDRELPEEAAREFNRQLRKMGVGSSYDQLFHLKQAEPGISSRPPAPTTALQLISSTGSSGEERPREIREWHLQHIFKHDPFGPQLFDGLPREVREQFSDLECKELCHQAYSVLFGYAADFAEDIALTNAQAIKRQFNIDVLEFDADLIYWPYTKPLSTFRLEQVADSPDRSILSGAAYGIPYEQLMDLLESLIIINDHPDIISQYQAAIDEQEERIRSYFSSWAKQSQ